MVELKCSPPPHAQNAVLRIVAYGDSLTAGFPSFEPYARQFMGELSLQGLHADVTVCGLCGLTAGDMLRCAGSSKPVYDPLRRGGISLLEAAKKKAGSWREADLVILMTGTNDLGTLSELQGPEEIAQRIIALHQLCLAEGIPTVAVGIPDAGGIRGTKRLKASEATLAHERQWLTWRKVANSLVARWCREPATQTAGGSLDARRPELFVSAGALLPFGPRTWRLGAWEPDTMHFTAVGSRLLGERLGCALTPLLTRLRSARVLCEEPSRSAHLHHKSGLMEDVKLMADETEDCQAEEVCHLACVRKTGYVRSSGHFENRRYPSWEREAAQQIQEFLLVQKGIRKHQGPSSLFACCGKGQVPLLLFV